MNRIAVRMLTTLAILTRLSAARAAPDVVLHEALADPVSESTGEFVELYNTGQEAVDLAGWLLADAADTNDIVMDYTGVFDSGVPGTVVPPGGYALIVDPDYTGEYNESIRRYADLTRLIVVTIKGDRTLGNGLGNTADRIVLRNPAGISVTFSWTKSAGSGSESWEKKRPRSGDDESNWKPSRAAEGHTAGYRNSVTPERRDAGLAPDSFDFSPVRPAPGAPVSLTVRILNQGADSLGPGEVRFYADHDRDGHFTDSELVADFHQMTPIQPEDSVQAHGIWTPSEGGRFLLMACADFSEDGATANDSVRLTINVGYRPQAVVINEIMFDAGSEGPEWIEGYNRGDAAVDLSGWMISVDDTLHPRRLVYKPALVAPGGFFVIVEDTAAFAERYAQVTTPVLQPTGGWPTLRNSGAVVFLMDLTAQVIDSVTYESGWSAGTGISTERLLPQSVTGDGPAWGPCADPDGATPGRVNALFAERIPARLSVTVSPNPFSPDGDGAEDIAVITVHLPAPYARLTVDLYDLSGRLIRVIMDDALSGARRTLVWNGTDDRNRALYVGPYILRVVMTKLETGERMVRKQLVVIARTA